MGAGWERAGRESDVPLPRAKQAMKRGTNGISVRIEVSHCPVRKRGGGGLGTIGTAEERKGGVPLLCLRVRGQGGLK